MIRGRDYKHTVELFKAVQVLDSYSMPVTSFVSLGSVPAAVKVLTGSRAMAYQEVGITNPVQVEIRKLETEDVVAKLIWLGYEIIARSVLSSDQVDGYEGRDRGKFLVIEGSFKVLTTTTTTTTTAG
jgi:hypothetical protein